MSTLPDDCTTSHEQLNGKSLSICQINIHSKEENGILSEFKRYRDMNCCKRLIYGFAPMDCPYLSLGYYLYDLVRVLLHSCISIKAGCVQLLFRL